MSSIDITYSSCEKCSSLNRIAFSFPTGKLPICGQCKNPLNIHDGVNELSVSNLNHLTQKSPLPVVVDFWAPWCNPCRSFAPTFIASANNFKNHFVFGKMDTEKNETAGASYGIKSIPTLIIFNRGTEVRRISGALSLDSFTNWIKQKS